MDRLEFELETRDAFELETRGAAEQFRKELEARIPKELRLEKVEYRGEQADYFHLSVLRQKTLMGSYSYEKDGQVYTCTLDFKKMPELEMKIPEKKIPPGALKFIRYLRPGYVQINTKDSWAQKGFKTRGGLTLNQTLGRTDASYVFAHQSISREDGTLALRYDIESDDKLYLCHLDIRITEEEHEKLFNLFDIWVHHHFNQKFSGQKTQHHTSPQSACEPAKQT